MQENEMLVHIISKDLTCLRICVLSVLQTVLSLSLPSFTNDLFEIQTAFIIPESRKTSCKKHNGHVLPSCLSLCSLNKEDKKHILSDKQQVKIGLAGSY